MTENLTPAPSPVPSPAAKDHQEGLRSFVSTIALLLVAIPIAFFLTAFVFQSYEVDGPSMQNTLQNHDRLIVLKLPRSWARITHHDYVPSRGDIIVFNHEESTDLTVGASRQLIKRIIGLPGDHIVVKDGQLTVYNQQHPNGFSPDKTLSYGGAIGETPGNVDVVIAEGHLFVCGDNRTNSLDSRYFGPINNEDVVGKLGLRYYPFGKHAIF